MWIHCTWRQGALGSPFWYSSLFILECLLCGLAVNSIASASIPLLYRTSEPHRRWDRLDFQRFKTPVERLLTLLGCAIPWCCCFVLTYLNVSFFAERYPVPESHTAAVDVAAQQLHADIPIKDTSSRPPITTARARSTTVSPSTAPATTKSSPLHAEDRATEYSVSTPPVHSPAADIVNAGAHVIDPRLDTDHMSMGSTADTWTRAAGDESSNSSKGDISGDHADEESSAVTEVAPSASRYLTPLGTVMKNWLAYDQALATRTSLEQALTDSDSEMPSTPCPKPRGWQSSQSQRVQRR